MKTLLAVLTGILFLALFVRFLCTYHVTNSGQRSAAPLLPMVINTWNFSEANKEAWRLLNLEKGGVGQTRSAVVGGISICEKLQCDMAVGYGGNPDERGDTSLDALLMDGGTMEVGAVGDLRRVKSAIKVAQHVMEHTLHTLLVGDGADDFGIAMGFQNESLNSNKNIATLQNWTAHNCQPNFWRNVYPDPRTSCGPYNPLPTWDANATQSERIEIGPDNHDTITMAAIDEEGYIHVGTSTNGLRHTMPGRVGDASIPGSAAYADNEVGAAVTTGDGDILMRFLPSLLAVEAMRAGKTPAEAVELVIQRIRKHETFFDVAIIVVNRLGTYAVGCHGTGVATYNGEFGYMVSSPGQPVRTESVPCTTDHGPPSEAHRQVIW
ncbi:putative N(4)-(beta-N-acetylglucosaminyl)-L-asparaginase GE19290 [Drosophila teissieri]|uniref:putative N(4)-(beta-N-acetylglucosaminyl)-L-asparaginase GE19290 n=1 Tax=Drosophila teissieri TaxID=7243 RepID=UPI001CBA1DFE|nr:putative N(4)-(beta-N-acetylglucosaminyl)-L-asparaginase GE19290 [Drosophila teissieri]